MAYFAEQIESRASGGRGERLAPRHDARGPDGSLVVVRSAWTQECVPDGDGHVQAGKWQHLPATVGPDGETTELPVLRLPIFVIR